jgi:rsbT antagonist protein RsbS
LLALRDDLAERVGSYGTRGVIVDVAALDVIDSFVARVAALDRDDSKLRGAETVIVGIQPDVAVAMVHFHLNLEPLRATLDLDGPSPYSIASRTEGARDGG